MNTFQLSCFLAVAETLNFAKAAENLHVTQPAITHQIQSLEAELNARLFRRSTRSVEITPAGIAFLHDARSILGISERAKHRFSDPDGERIQPFSIGCHSYAFLFLLPDLLRTLSARYPLLHPSLRVVPFQYLYRLLAEETVDVIIGFQEQNAKRVPGIYQELLKVPLVCICAPDHPLASLDSVTADSLSQYPLILHNPTQTPGTLNRLQAFLLEGRSPSDLYFCDVPEAAVVLAQAGLGVSVMPGLLIPPDCGLAQLPLQGEYAVPASFGVYYRDAKGSAVLKSFLSLLRKSFPPQMGGTEGSPLPSAVTDP